MVEIYALPSVILVITDIIAELMYSQITSNLLFLQQTHSTES